MSFGCNNRDTVVLSYHLQPVYYFITSLFIPKGKLTCGFYPSVNTIILDTQGQPAVLFNAPRSFWCYGCPLTFHFMKPNSSRQANPKPNRNWACYLRKIYFVMVSCPECRKRVLKVSWHTTLRWSVLQEGMDNFSYDNSIITG